jgi:DNA modification methylase
MAEASGVPVAKRLGPIEDRAPSALIPREKQPRAHPRKQITKLAASIRAFGFTSIVLIDEQSSILSGHGRVEAAIELGLPTIPTRTVFGWTEAEKRAFVIGDNKLGLLSEWVPELLKNELELLIADDEVNIETTGFSTGEVDLLIGEPESKPADDLQAKDFEWDPTARQGDVYRLGENLLFCGDSLVAASYDMLVQAGEVQLVVTDAPYNVPIEGHVGNKGKIQHPEFKMASGEMTREQFISFLQVAFGHAAARMADGGLFFGFMDWRHNCEIQTACESIFGDLRQLCVWVKDNGGMGTFYRSQHELVFVYKKGDAPHINNFELGQHGRYRTNVWNYPGASTFKGQKLLALHPTVKPVALVADVLRDCSHRNGVVLDPFCGSGTILIAAERTGRRARAIELDPRYVDVAIARWQRVTGKQAVLVETGQTWDEVGSVRRREALGVPA